MSKFILKPAVYDAFVFSLDETTYPDWFIEATKESIHKYGFVKISKQHAGMQVTVFLQGDILTGTIGDYIVKSSTGEISIYNKDNFNAFFEEVTE